MGNQTSTVHYAAAFDKHAENIDQFSLAVQADADPAAGHFSHDPYAIPAGSAPPPSRHGYEEMLIELALRFLHDTTFNPFECSVPVERLQQRLLSHSPALFSFVIGQGSWKGFLRRHPEHFIVAVRHLGRLSVRSHRHVNWEHGERQQSEFRKLRDAQLCQWLRTFLTSRPEARAAVRDVVEAFNSQSEPGREIARGDLVRFIMKRRQLFTYDASDKALYLNATDCDACSTTSSQPSHPGAL